MKAAIIGANSYIARNLIRVNQETCYAEMVLYDRQETHLDGAEGYQQIDLTQQSDLERAASDCDLIYFFVGKTGTIQGFDNPDPFIDINEKFLMRLLNACRAVHTKAKIIFPSTRLVYRGSEDTLPEDAEKQFLTPYAIQKFACEQYLEMYHRLYDLNYCVLRICVPYGTLVHPVSSYGTLDAFLKQAEELGQISIYGDGAQRRTFTYIGDLCHVLWQAGLNGECVNNIYNVGGEDASIRVVAERVAAAVGASVAQIPWPAASLKVESGSTVFNSQKLDSLLGFRAAFTVDQWLAGGLAKEKIEMVGKSTLKNSIKSIRGGGTAE